MLRPIRSLLRRHLSGLLAAALLLPALALPASASAAERVFVITGRGFGHGIGMSQYGAKGYAEHGWLHEAILKHYYKGVGFGSISNPQVRVALQKYDTAVSTWQLRTHDYPMWVTNGSTGFSVAKGVTVTFAASGGSVRVTASGIDKTLSGGVYAYSNMGGGHKGLIEVVSPTGTWDRANVVYRGQMRLDSDGAGKVRLRNWLYMEEYLKGVIPRESPSSWHIEALKAQTVAARSYAYKSLQPTKSFDVYSTTQDQVYGGYGHYAAGAIERYETDRTNTAVSGTANKVVKYGSDVIMAYFFSTSGGYTENIEKVWGNTSAKPYLVGVPDDYESSAGSSRHIWQDTRSYTASQLRAKLQAGGLPVPGTIADMVVTKRGVSGRATEVLLKGAAGDDKLLTLKDPSTGVNEVGRIRNGLALSSTWFYVTSSWASGPSSVAYGLKTTFRLDIRPAYTYSGLQYVYTGPAGGALTNKVTVPVKAGVGYFALAPTAATDVLLSAGGRGYANLFVSPRFRISVSRRLSLAASRNSGRVDLVGYVTPASGAGSVVFEYLAPGSTIWRTVATAATDTYGKATASQSITSVGTWAFRVRHAGDSKFVAGTSAPVKIDVDLDPRIERIIGEDRYDTSVKIAEAHGPVREGTVVVAGGLAGPDALTGAALAGAYGSPLLLAEPTTLPTGVRQWVANSANHVTDVIVVGGTSAVGDEVVSALESVVGAGKVSRVAGPDRASTAAEVAARVRAKLGSAYAGGAMIVNGWSMSDAAAASAVSAGRGWPILFVRSDSVPASTAAAMKPVASGGGGIGTSQAWVVGGKSAVGDAVFGAIDAASGTVTRASGADRYATALDLASKARAAGAATYSRIGLVSSTGIVDALALGPHAALLRGVLLLTPPTTLDARVASFLKTNEAAIGDVVIVGGSAVMGESVVRSVDAALP